MANNNRWFIRWALPVLILLLGGGGFAALKASKPESAPLVTEEKVWIVAVETVTPAEISPTLILYGRVESPRVAMLSAAVAADVEEVPVLEGQWVEKDDPLVLLDDRESTLLLKQRVADVADFRAQIDNEKERYRNDLRSLEREKMLLALSRKAVRRAQELAGKSMGSKSQLDQAREAEERQALTLEQRELSIREHASRLAQLEARLARAEALRDQAQLDVDRTRVTSPFTGRVSDVLVTEGYRVRIGDQLIELYDKSAIEIRAQIPTRYLPAVQERSRSGVRLSAKATLDGAEINATLDRLTGQVQRGTGGVDGLFRATSGGEWLQLGRTIKLALELPPESNVVPLPLEAIYGTDRIFKLNGERLSALTVERLGTVRGSDGRSRALVRSPELAAGEQVVVTQLPNAIDGLRVRVASNDTIGQERSPTEETKIKGEL